LHVRGALASRFPFDTADEVIERMRFVVPGEEVLPSRQKPRGGPADDRDAGRLDRTEVRFPEILGRGQGTPDFGKQSLKRRACGGPSRRRTGPVGKACERAVEVL
jgi:hypothetical protein